MLQEHLGRNYYSARYCRSNLDLVGNRCSVNSPDSLEIDCSEERQVVPPADSGNVRQIMEELNGRILEMLRTSGVAKCLRFITFELRIDIR